MSWMKMAVAGFVLCAGASVASAQGAPAAPGAHSHGDKTEMRGGRGQAMLFEGITLTASQQQKVDSIRASWRAERQKASPNSGRADAAARTRMKEAMEKQNAAIRAILTTEQQKVFDANVAEMKQRRDKRRAAPRA